MKLTCSQMDVLISFYLDGDLSSSLKQEVENHLQSCATCRAKFDIISSMLTELKTTLSSKEDNNESLLNFNATDQSITSHYNLFRTNLSAYIDNELSAEENIKIKKFAISNSSARKDLEANFNIRKLMNDSFKKSESEVKQDFSRSVLKQLELDEETALLGIHPLIKILALLTLVVLISSVAIIFVLNA